jgi:glycosyltransferase involved in cell wall biosynthesis
MTAFEIVADLSALPADVAARLVMQWAADDVAADSIAMATFALPPLAREACVGVPPVWRMVPGPAAPGFWNAILAAAGREGRAVAVLIAPVAPGAEAVGILLELLESDEMYGAAAARVQCWDGCCLQTVAHVGGIVPEWVPFTVLADLPAYELPGDVLTSCVALKPVVLTDFADVEPPIESLAGTVAHRLISARKCGYRTALANRAVVRMPGAECEQAAQPPVSIPAGDSSRVAALDSEIDRAWSEGRGGALERFEKLTGQLVRTRRGGRPSLLLDIRNVRATFNGTTAAALGAAHGLHQTAGAWDVSLLAHPAGAAFHDFESAFPGWHVYTSRPPTAFTAALRLSQPWHIEEMVDLHHAARINAYLMLDTIAWDVQYVAPPHLDGTWRFLATTADGLLFISDFSRQRFAARFPKAADRACAVCYLSFDPADYARPELAAAPEEDYILVVGNRLDHKDVSATVGALATAFPFERLQALGPSPFRSDRITAHASGQLGDINVHRLYAGAKLVVFPSFYEGFGLPVVTALAYGRTLCARESSLLREVSSHCVPRGRLISYRQRDDLVDIVGRVLHGLPNREMPVGTTLNGGSPRSWRQAGIEIEGFLQSLMESASAEAWRWRDELVSQALAFRT